MKYLPALLVLFLSCPFGVRGLEIQLKLVRGKQSMGRSANTMGRSRLASDKFPAHIVSDDAVVFADAPGWAAPIVLDEPGGTGTGHSRLWLDLDGDGVLGPKEYMDVGPEHFRQIRDFKRFVTDGGSRHEVKHWGYALHQSGYSRVTLSSGATFAGRANVDGAELNIWVCDADGDGRVIQPAVDDFHNAGAYFGFSADTNMSDALWLPLTKQLGLLGRFYSLDIAFTAGGTNPVLTVTLDAADPATGAVEVTGDSVLRVCVAGTNGAAWIEPGKAQCALPAGKWEVLGVRVADCGITFRTHLARDRNEKVFDVAAGRVTELGIGGPLRHAVGIADRSRMGRLRLILLPSSGVAGLKYYPIWSGDSKPPGWLIRRPGGRTIASGSFEFG